MIILNIFYIVVFVFLVLCTYYLGYTMGSKKCTTDNFVSEVMNSSDKIRKGSILAQDMNVDWANKRVSIPIQNLINYISDTGKSDLENANMFGIDKGKLMDEWDRLVSDLKNMWTKYETKTSNNDNIITYLQNAVIPNMESRSELLSNIQSSISQNNLSTLIDEFIKSIKNTYNLN